MGWLAGPRFIDQVNECTHLFFSLEQWPQWLDSFASCFLGRVHSDHEGHSWHEFEVCNRSAWRRRGRYHVPHTDPKSWHRRNFRNCKQAAFLATLFLSCSVYRLLLGSYYNSRPLHRVRKVWKENRRRRTARGWGHVEDMSSVWQRPIHMPVWTDEKMPPLPGEPRKMERAGVSLHKTESIWCEVLILPWRSSPFFGG